MPHQRVELAAPQPPRKLQRYGHVLLELRDALGIAQETSVSPSMSPASKLKRATSNPASLIAASTSPRSSPAGHQNSTALKPASLALPNRSSSGTSLNRIETLAQNFIYGLLSLPPTLYLRCVVPPQVACPRATTPAQR